MHCFLSLSLSLSFSLTAFLSISFSPCTSMRVPMYRDKKNRHPYRIGVTQVTHHSSCTHGNRVDSDLSPINKPFRMPTRSARTSATSN